MGADQRALAFEVLDRTASAHFIGGIPIADTAEAGAADPYQRAFGYPGLHVMDSSVMPANPGVNPSLMITALAERAMSLWPNKGDPDAAAPARLRLPAGRGRGTAPPGRPAGRARRAPPGRQATRRHPRTPLLTSCLR